MTCYVVGADRWLPSILEPLVVGFVVTAVAGPATIASLSKFSLRQQAYEDAPATHAKKTGTPTMGGMLFVLALLVLLAAFAIVFLGSSAHFTASAQDAFEAAAALIGLGLGCAAIGFADDYAGVARAKNRGLSARFKLVLTALVAIAYLAVVPHAATLVGLGAWAWAVPAWAWYALGFVAILGTTHAVNLTDGLDGLAAGTIVPPLLLFAWIALRCPGETSGLGYVDALLAGSAGGFLLFNRHPARVFMGDTGSLLLGGVLAGSAVALDQQLLLIVVGGVFVAEALSVMIQVAYFKRTKKRIFRMSPLHHHFELGGWAETKVTARFWAASALLSIVGALLVGLQSVA